MAAAAMEYLVAFVPVAVLDLPIASLAIAVTVERLLKQVNKRSRHLDPGHVHVVGAGLVEALRLLDLDRVDDDRGGGMVRCDVPTGRGTFDRAVGAGKRMVRSR